MPEERKGSALGQTLCPPEAAIVILSPRRGRRISFKVIFDRFFGRPRRDSLRMTEDELPICHSESAEGETKNL